MVLPSIAFNTVLLSVFLFPIWTILLAIRLYLGNFLSSMHPIYHSNLSYSSQRFFFSNWLKSDSGSILLNIWCLTCCVYLMGIVRWIDLWDPQLYAIMSASKLNYVARAETSPRSFSVRWIICSPLFSPFDLPSKFCFPDSQLQPKRVKPGMRRRGACQQCQHVICGVKFY